MPISLFVAPAAGRPDWWLATDRDGLSFHGAYPWSKADLPPDSIRQDGYRLAYGEVTGAWRSASTEEATAALWHLLEDEDGQGPPVQACGVSRRPLQSR